MLTVRNVLVVLLFSLLLRVIIELVFAGAFNQYYLSLAAQAIMYVVMISIAYFQFRPESAKIFSSLHWNINHSMFAVAAGIGLLLVAFTLGENAVEVLMASHFSSSFAYSFWHFSRATINPDKVYSMRVVSFVFVTCVLGPIVEEFIFRALLLKAASRVFGVWNAVFMGSVLFTVLHFSSHYYISTFIFSVILYLVVIVESSLVMCVVIHGVFNLVAFIHQYYFDIQWTKSVSDISVATNWTPQLVMFVTSLLVITYLVVKNWNRILLSIKRYSSQIELA